MYLVCFFFFFSSRRRHTRYWRDWSSDVCSSDLHRGSCPPPGRGSRVGSRRPRSTAHASSTASGPWNGRRTAPSACPPRSEERRVGKEGRSRGVAEESKKKERRGELWTGHSDRA